MAPKQSKEDSTFDVEKRQNNLFDASVRNTLLANESISMAQNSMLALGLAELAFLGVILVDTDRRNYETLVKTLIILLIISFTMFLLGQIRQYKHQLKAARRFEKKANRALEYLSEGKQYLSSEPKDIATGQRQIVSDVVANLLIFVSLVIIVVATIGTLGLVIAI